MIITKLIPQLYSYRRYLLAIIFLLGVESIWLAPAIAIDSTTQTSLEKDTAAVAEDVTGMTNTSTMIESTTQILLSEKVITTDNKTDTAVTENATDTTTVVESATQMLPEKVITTDNTMNTAVTDVTGTTTTMDATTKVSPQINTQTTNKRYKNGSLFDSGAPPKTNIALTPNLYFGARFDMELQIEQGFNLDTEDAEDIFVLEPALSLAFNYIPTKNLSMFLNIQPTQALVVDQDDKKRDKTRLEVIQAYLSIKKAIGDLDIKIGRQRFKDKREWLYDEELDGIRFSHNFPKAAVEFSVSKKRHKDLINEGKDEKVTNYVLFGKYTLNKKINVATYIFAQNDSTAARENPLFYGLQLSGKHTLDLNDETTDKLKYWLELARVGGRSGANKISAIGFDIGTIYRFDHPLKPAVTFGYAYGSGDGDPSDNIDRNFRQTGLQDNDAKFNGVVRIKYYGEMFDPELSNLAIYTAGFGVWPTRKISVDLTYHRYRQNQTSNTIRNSEIDQDPNGLSRELGQEIDLVVGYRGKKRRSKISFILGHFTPSSAFPNGRNARFLEMKYRYNF